MEVGLTTYLDAALQRHWQETSNEKVDKHLLTMTSVISASFLRSTIHYPKSRLQVFRILDHLCIPLYPPPLLHPRKLPYQHLGGLCLPFWVLANTTSVKISSKSNGGSEADI